MQLKSDFYVPHLLPYVQIHQDVFRGVWISFINILRIRKSWAIYHLEEKLKELSDGRNLENTYYLSHIS